jgi:hypothetical protein
MSARSLRDAIPCVFAPECSHNRAVDGRPPDWVCEVTGRDDNIQGLQRMRNKVLVPPLAANYGHIPFPSICPPPQPLLHITLESVGERRR